jgi:hypothetical protein
VVNFFRTTIGGRTNYLTPGGGIPARHPLVHPRHKLQYFQDVGWEDDWIATAERIVRDRFESGYCEDQPTDEPQVGDEVRHLYLFYAAS